MNFNYNGSNLQIINDINEYNNIKRYIDELKKIMKKIDPKKLGIIKN